MNLDDLLFFGGIGLAAAAAVIGIICLVYFKIKKMKLESQFDEEYGPATKIDTKGRK